MARWRECRVDAAECAQDAKCAHIETHTVQCRFMFATITLLKRILF